MTNKAKIALAGGFLAVALSTVAWSQMTATESGRPLRGITVDSIHSLSAGDNNTAWAISTNGSLLHCRFEDAKVTCYDRNGAVTSGY